VETRDFFKSQISHLCGNFVKMELHMRNKRGNMHSWAWP